MPLNKEIEYFDNERHNSAAPEFFAEIVKVMNPTGMRGGVSWPWNIA